MDQSRRLLWLKRILLVKVVVTLVVWGLPALLGPASLLGLLKLPVPQDFTYLRLFGAVVTAFAVAYWLAYRDPIDNRAIIQAGIVDNGLVTLVVIALWVLRGAGNWFTSFSAVLTAAFCILFIILLPPGQPLHAGPRE
jgi:hypothetical protein